MTIGFFDLLHLMGVWFSRPLGPYWGDAVLMPPHQITASEADGMASARCLLGPEIDSIVLPADIPVAAIAPEQSIVARIAPEYAAKLADTPVPTSHILPVRQ